MKTLEVLVSETARTLIAIAATIVLTVLIVSARPLLGQEPAGGPGEAHQRCAAFPVAPGEAEAPGEAATALPPDWTAVGAATRDDGIFVVACSAP